MSDIDDLPEPSEDDLVALDELLSDPELWAEPPADLEDRIVAGLTNAKPVFGTSPISDESDSEPERKIASPRPDNVVPLRRNRFPLLAAAAAVVLVALIGVVALNRDDGSTTDEIAGVEVPLAGTDLAPDAVAVVDVAETPLGVRFRFEIDGLDPAPDGFVYQGWVRNDDQIVTIGTFHMRGGDGSLALWSGVEAGAFPTITVTLEPVDDDPSSSGQVVLRGDIPAGSFPVDG